jgi:hypothetical protein
MFLTIKSDTLLQLFLLLEIVPYFYVLVWYKQSIKVVIGRKGSNRIKGFIWPRDWYWYVLGYVPKQMGPKGGLIKLLNTYQKRRKKIPTDQTKVN